MRDDNDYKGVVTNYGRGATKLDGGHVKFYPYEKGGVEKVLAMLKGGHKRFPPFKRGGGMTNFTLS